MENEPPVPSGKVDSALPESTGKAGDNAAAARAGTVWRACRNAVRSWSMVLSRCVTATARYPPAASPATSSPARKTASRPGAFHCRRGSNDRMSGCSSMTPHPDPA